MEPTRILVVDDESDTRAMLALGLTRPSVKVITAGDGSEAIDRLKNESFDVVITDIRMPNASGLDVLSAAKRRSPSSRVILMTAYAGLDNAIAAVRGGASDFIQKPFTLEELESVVFPFVPPTTPGNSGTPAETHPLITENGRMKAILSQARQLAPASLPILITGESGTGKEVLSRWIHEMSGRSSEPFVAVNCAAVPHGLLESELFGHEKGAFTGAAERKIGKFELAERGTLLLDEISEMEPLLQAKLLRVLQEYEIDRLGGKRPIKIGARFIATSNRDLKREVELGRFREDLYFRLNAVSFTLPPLRERPEDIEAIARYILAAKGTELNRRLSLAPETVQILKGLYWRGNVRELKNTLERAVHLSASGEIEPEHLTVTEAPRVETVDFAGSLDDLERSAIIEALKRTGGNRTKAATALGISIRTLRNKLRTYRESGEGQILPMAQR